MKPLLISHSDSAGGAFIAARRLLEALRHNNIDCNMLVSKKTGRNPNIVQFRPRIENSISDVRVYVGRLINALQIKDDQKLRSGNWFPGTIIKSDYLNSADIVNLHWINSETLSIKQTAMISKPIVMTLHDMWAFCGTEHYVSDDFHPRFVDGYHKNNRSLFKKGIDIDRYVWERKKKYWKNKEFPLVTPSKWLSSCASKSDLFSDRKIYTVPNAVNTTVFKPSDKLHIRQSLGLPADKFLIGFSSLSGILDKRKGFDLLVNSMIVLRDSAFSRSCEFVIAGKKHSIPHLEEIINLNFLGYLSEEFRLAQFYNAIDLVVVPSRQESFGQIVSEAHACGTPVVAFDTTAISELVAHKVTGYLAKPFESEELANGILWFLHDENRLLKTGEDARERAVKLWSYRVVGKQYFDIYKKLI